LALKQSLAIDHLLGECIQAKPVSKQIENKDLWITDLMGAPTFDVNAEQITIYLHRLRLSVDHKIF
jgi:hypothetical protein